MALFHRFVDPSYYLFPGETFPAAPGGTGPIGLHTYDRVNVESGGVGAGGSANADGQVGGGLNQYTYFIQFGQDATSLNTNRGFRAVFESLDVVDDILRTSLPKRASQAAASPAANSVLLTGEVFVSDDPATPADELFYVVETATGRPIYNGVTRVVVTDVDTGVPGTIIGTTWATDPTVRFNTSINVAYTLYYGTRTTYGRVSEIEKSVWWTQEVAAARTAIAGEGTARHGFDERYRRATDITDSAATADTPGDGAKIIRDGQALQMSFPQPDLNGAPFPDRWLSGFQAYHDDYTEGGAFILGYGGDMGLLVLPGARATSSASEMSAKGPMRAAVASFIPRSIATDTVDGATHTRIEAGAAATLNLANADVALITLTGGDYFSNSAETAIYSDADVLVVEFGGDVGKSYIIQLDTAGLADNEARLTLPSGELANFAQDTEVTVTWYSALMLQGGTSKSPFEYYTPKELGASALGDYGIEPMKWVGKDGNGINAGKALLDVEMALLDGDTRIRQMAIFPSGSILSAFDSIGYVNGDSTLQAGIVHHNFAHRAMSFSGEPTGYTLHIDPSANTNAPGTPGMGFGVVSYGVTGAGLASYTLNINSSGGAGPTGTMCEIIIENHGDGADGMDITINWDSNFVFSDPSDAEMGPANLNQGAAVRWKGTRIVTVNSGGPKWFMERMDYQF